MVHRQITPGTFYRDFHIWVCFHHPGTPVVDEKPTKMILFYRHSPSLKDLTVPLVWLLVNHPRS